LAGGVAARIAGQTVSSAEGGSVRSGFAVVAVSGAGSRERAGHTRLARQAWVGGVCAGGAVGAGASSRTGVRTRRASGARDGVEGSSPTGYAWHASLGCAHAACWASGARCRAGSGVLTQGTWHARGGGVSARGVGGGVRYALDAHSRRGCAGHRRIGSCIT